MAELKQERLEYLANILTEHCHTDMACIIRSVSTCPFRHINCEDITPTDWLKYMQGLEVSEL